MSVIKTEDNTDTGMVDEINSMLDPSLADSTSDDGVTGDDVTGEALEAAGGDSDTEEVSAADESGTTETPSVTDGEAESRTEAGEADGEVFVEDIDAIRKRIADMSTAPQEVVIEGEGELFDPMAAFTKDIPYITEENLQQIADNPLLLNEAMNSVRKQTAEGILAVVPQLIEQAVYAQAQRTELHNTFYGAHPELAPYKAYVSSVAQTMATRLKDKSQEEILVEVAKSVKASLQLSGKQVEGKKDGVKPALRDKGKGGGRKTNVVVDENSLASQLTAMMQ